jgi:hypothetical protein
VLEAWEDGGAGADGNGHFGGEAMAWATSYSSPSKRRATISYSGHGTLAQRPGNAPLNSDSFSYRSLGSWNGVGSNVGEGYNSR